MAKVLIVDDEEMLVQMYLKKFEEEGFKVETALDGDIALEKLQNYHPDLMLLDVTMPKVDGLTVLKKVKADSQLQSIRVMILTNTAVAKEEEQRILAMGASALLLKADYLPKEIVKKVKETLA